VFPLSPPPRRFTLPLCLSLPLSFLPALLPPRVGLFRYGWLAIRGVSRLYGTALAAARRMKESR
jgi:hypothetical protein